MTRSPREVIEAILATMEMMRSECVSQASRGSLERSMALTASALVVARLIAEVKEEAASILKDTP